MIEFLTILLKVQIVAALVGALILQHGLISNGGDDYKSVGLTVVLFLAMNTMWFMYLVVLPTLFGSKFKGNYFHVMKFLNRMIYQLAEQYEKDEEEEEKKKKK